MLFKKKKIWFLLFSIIAISAVTAYFIKNNNREEIKEINKQANTQNFINLGQKKNDLKSNKFSSLNVEELTAKANSIISKADLLVSSSSFKASQLTAEQKQQIDSEILKLEQQIQILEKNLSKNK